jgi:hypothetical protein
MKVNIIYLNKSNIIMPYVYNLKLTIFLKIILNNLARKSTGYFMI